MFRFEHIEYLFYLAGLPLLGIFYFLYQLWRTKAFKRLGDLNLVERLAPELSKAKQWLKFAFFSLGVLFLIVGLANPQWGTKKEKIKRKGVDVFVALDISKSMLAEDIPPNRLERAKRFCLDLVEELKGERIGLILFAGNAYMQMPLTTDYAAASIFIRSANTNMAPNQGTAISDAIDIAERSFEPENKKHKVLIIISDGENHEEVVIERTKEAANNGLVVYTIGIGSPDGGFIPEFVNGQQNYKRDKTGKPVRTFIDEKTLIEVADIGGGAYFNMENKENIFSDIETKIDSMEKREFEQQSFSEYESYFQYFLGIGLLFFLLSLLVSDRKSKLLRGSLFEI